MSKTLMQRLLAMPKPCASQQQGMVKFTEILATHVLEFPPFEQIPNAFLRIEFGAEAGNRSRWMRAAAPAAKKSLIAWQ